MSTWKAVSLVVLLAVCVSAGQAQFKSQREAEDRVSDGIASAPSSLFLGWFDPAKFQMHHSFSLSYQTLGGQGLSLGTYTNSMTYQFSEKLNARADVSMMYSPYNSFGTFGKGGRSDFSSVFLSNAEVNYRPWQNVQLRVQFRQMPYYNPYYSPYYSPWFWELGF